jgi:NADPH:quinone reductase
MLYGLFLGEELMRPNAISASALLHDLARRMAAGRLQPTIGRSAAWTDIDVVVRAMLRRDFIGKAVLTVS